MKIAAAAAICILLAVFPTPAQEPTKQTKIEQLLALTHVQTQTDQMFSQIKAMSVSQLQASAAGGTPEQQAKAQELTGKLLDLMKNRMSWDRMRPQYVQLYDEVFSASEIDGMLAFYRSPAGQAVIEKMPVVMSKAMMLGQAQMGDLLPEIQRMVREQAGQK